MTDIFTDRLDALISQFPVRAQTFHSGALCGFRDFSADADIGQIHLIKSGKMEIHHHGGDRVQIQAPSILLYSRPVARRFVADPQSGTDLVCANLSFDGGSNNPIAYALPDFICLPLESIESGNAILGLLFEEAFGDKCGRRILMDRLFEVVLIQVLRHLMEGGQIGGGMLGGLSHPNLRKALIAIHEKPAEGWTLNTLASTAGMSRSLFAATFRQVVGCTPGVYLQGWRIQLAQRALLDGRSLKIIALDVGYGSEAALSRAFKSFCGMSPKDWRRAFKGSHLGT